MTVMLERYPLTEIARLFVENKYGGLDALLQALKEGALKAEIEFPPYLLDNWFEVPEEFWENLKPWDFDVLAPTSRSRRKGAADLYEIPVKDFSKAEKRRIDTLGDAIASKNFDLIDQGLKPTVISSLNDEDASQEDWSQIVNIYRDLVLELWDCQKQMFPVYVNGDDWHEFVSEHVIQYDIDEKTGKSGRQPNPHWGAIWEEAARFIWNSKEVPKRSALGKHLFNWSCEKFEAKNSPKRATIDGKLRNIEPKS